MNATHRALPWFTPDAWGWHPAVGARQLALTGLRQAVRAELGELGLQVPEADDALPAWTASVARGGDLPDIGPVTGAETQERMALLVDELRALGGLVDLPPVRAPQVHVLARGHLVARGADDFAIDLRFRDGGHGAVDPPTGPAWTRVDGTLALLPADLLLALRDLVGGPPDRIDGEPNPAWTDRRMLWWARIRPVIERQGAELVGSIATTWAIEIDRPAPVVELGPDGTAEVGISAPTGLPAGVSPKAIGESLDHLPDGFTAHPGIRFTGPGGRERVRVVTGARGIEALRQLKTLRRQARTDPEVVAQLVEAPHTIFDADLFDLSQYSDRVIGVRPVLYRVFRAPSGPADSRPRYRLLPVGGGSVDTDDLAPRLTPEQRADLERRLEEARQRGRPYLCWSPDHTGSAIWIRVPPEEVLGGPEPDDQVAPGASGVLDVKLNVEELQYQVDDGGVGLVAGLRDRIEGLREPYRLKRHQVEGVGWLAGHALLVTGASDHGLLADDMGLGKTLQVLSLMRLLQADGHLSPTLVVAPLSLLLNWASEAEKFYPGCFGTPLIIGGPGSARPTADRVRRSPLTLASYEALRTHQLELGKVRFKLMVLDESHRIKNPTAATTRAALAMDAERRLALTGTPVQNTLVDLWSQVDWLAPGFLEALPRFRRTYETADTAPLDALREKMAPRILRRMKRDVLADELPPIEQDPPGTRLPMPASLEALYSEIQNADDDGRGGFRKLHQLLRCCSHPGYLTDDPVPDPKRRWLQQTLRDIHRRGEKALLFAEWHDLQTELCAEIEREHGVRVDRINGTVDAGVRLAVVDAFNRAPGFGVLVLGPKAAGVGLNITGANHVIHYTRHWNPAHEMQATDRAYRIGQRRPVTVYRPILTREDEPTIEEYMDDLLREKQELATDVVVPTARLDVQVELSARVFGSGR